MFPIRTSIISPGLALLLLPGQLAAPRPADLTVFAAASLTEAFTALARRYEAAHPGVVVRLNFAGSQTLAAQLSQGARADLLATADERWMSVAVAGGLVEGDPRVFARNRLVVILPAANPGRVSDLVDLSRAGLKLVLAAPQVPVGHYSRKALERLGGAPGYPTGYAAQVLRNVVSEEENVRAVVAKVQLGEADAGICYATDVVSASPDRVRILGIPEPYNPLASYPIAVLRGAAPGAREFMTLVLSAEGRAELARLGFLPPAAPAP